MNEYHQARVDFTNACHAKGPAYAAEFTKLTGREWSYVDHRNPDEESGYWSYFNLVDTTNGASIHVSISQHDKKVTATPNLPNLPNGSDNMTRMIWRDLRFTTPAGEHQKVEQPEAGVSLDRFHNEIPACARRFVKMVVTPYAAVYPQIVDKVKAAADSYVERDRVVSDLCRDYRGHVSQHNRGSSVTVYFPGNLPCVEVSAGGYLRLNHPSFNDRTLRAYFNAILETDKSV